MNERLKELAAKCWDTRLGRMSFDQEQFANLIVQDIIKIIDGYVETSPEIMGLPLDILEHFDMEYNEND